MRRWGRWLALVAGLVIFSVYLAGTDFRAVGETLRRLGYWAPVLLLPYGVVYMVDTCAWRFAFEPGLKVSFLRLFRIRWMGESVNNLVPTAYVGGEAIKVLFLRREGIPTSAATAAALISKTAQTVGQVLFLILGAGAYLSIRGGGGEQGVLAGLSLVVLGGCGVVALLLWLQRRGVAAMVYRLLKRLRPASRRLEARRAALEALDETVAGFYRSRRGRFLACVGGFLLGWMLDTVEVYLAGQLLGLPIRWSQALVIESFTGVVKIVGLWVPGALGVQESGIVLLSRWVGAPDVFGQTYALLRRFRELVYAGIGWAWLGLAGVPVPGEDQSS